MKRCPNCDIPFSDAETICAKCAAKLEPVQDGSDPTGRESGIDLRKKDKTSGALPDASGSTVRRQDAFAGDPLEAAKACFQAGEFSECIRRLEKAMETGVTGARRTYGCFLDDSREFRLAVERHRYSDRITPSSFASSSPSSVRTEQASATSAEPSGDGHSGSSSPAVFPGASGAGPAASGAGPGASVAGPGASDPQALFQAGRAALERGQYDSAFQSFRRAAEADHAMAQYYLGECYSDGKGVPRDPEKAAKWYRQAVTQFESPGVGPDDAEALLCLGGCYENGKGVKRNSEKAVRFFIRAARQYRRAAERGDEDAMYRLGSFCENGIGIEKNEVDAVKWYLKAMQQFRGAAEQGDAAAQFKLGRCYDEGKGVDEDKAEAAKWFRKAAEQGHDGAQLKLGDCLYYGRGVDKDKAEAVRWYRKAEEQGNAFAGKRLSAVARKKRLATAFLIFLLLLLIVAGSWGIWYFFLNPDSIFQRGEKEFDQGRYDAAVELYEKAAEKGHADAQFKLGKCYEEGIGVGKDVAEAVKWYELAAKQGHAEAQHKLDELAFLNDAEKIYQLGETSFNSREFKEAVKWYQMAADKGHASAQYSLGFCYLKGFGVEKDKDKAIECFQKAAEQGDALAKNALRNL